MMRETHERTGPAGHRFYVMLLNVLLALLVYWLLGFMMADIGHQPGPSIADVEKQYLDPTLLSRKKTLIEQSDKLYQTTQSQQQQLTIIQTSITSYRDTMNQLLDLQKVSVEKGMPFSSDSQNNLKNVTRLYLDYQQQFQDLNHAISNNNLEEEQLKRHISELDRQLSKQTDQANIKYSALLVNHNLMMAGLQLLILVPLLFTTAYFYRRYRSGIYKPMFIALNVSVILKIIFVMHEHFPSRVFKYILVIVLIYMTARVLISMLRMTIAPKLDWLIKQYREAYQTLKCPVCQFPIQPGALKFCRHESIVKNPMDVDIHYLDHIDTYICPSCGEQLFEKCDKCAHARHSLLVYCDHCGAEKDIQ